MTQTSSTDTADLPVVQSVMAVAFIALGLSKVPSTAAAVAVAVIVGVLPLAVLVSFRWRGRISEQRCMREGGFFIPGIGIYPLVAAINPDWATAIVLGTASVYLLVAGRAPWRRTRLPRRWLWVSVAGCTIAGVLADFPTLLGWHALAYSCFGAAAFAALTAAIGFPLNSGGVDDGES